MPTDIPVTENRVETDGDTCYGILGGDTKIEDEDVSTVLQDISDRLGETDAGGKINVGAGAHVLTEPVGVHDNVTISGDSVRSTFFKTGQIPPGKPAFYGADTHRNTFEKFTIAGWDRESDGIHLVSPDSHPTFHTIRDVQVYNHRVALSLENCEESRIERVTSNGNSVSLRYTAPEGRIYIHDSRLAAGESHTLEISALQAGINGCIITGTDSDSLIYQITNVAEQVNIRDSWFEKFPTVYDTGGYKAGHISMRDCYVVAGEENSIISGGARSLSLQNNTFHSKDGSAVTVTDTQISSATAENNHFNGNVSWGVMPRDM